MHHGLLIAVALSPCMGGLGCTKAVSNLQSGCMDT